MPRAARIQIRRLRRLGIAGPHLARFCGFRPRPLHHRRQGIGQGRDRALPRIARRRPFHHALPVARIAAGAGAELDPAPRPDLRVVTGRRKLSFSDSIGTLLGRLARACPAYPRLCFGRPKARMTGPSPRCPVEVNWLSATIFRQPKATLPGLGRVVNYWKTARKTSRRLGIDRKTSLPEPEIM